MRFLKSFFSLALCLAVSAVIAQVDLNNGLQAYYPFNGNANDASGHGNNPSVVNATLTSDYYGKANSAYYFDGASSFIQIPNSSSLNSSSKLSVCAWIKPQGFYKGKCHGNRIIMKGLDGGNTLGNYLLTFDDGQYTNWANCANNIVDTIHQTAYGYGTQITATTDTPYIQANVWKSLVYTYDGQYARLYVDCELIIETYKPGLSFNNAYDLFIGKMDNPQYPYYFNGIVDEVRIYNRALNEEEIKAYSFGCKSDAQNSLCTGSLGDPIVNITFGSGSNPGNQLSTIVPGASTTYNYISVSGNPANPVPNDGSYTITNNVPDNFNWFSGASDHTGNGNGYMAFFNANPVPGEFYKQTVASLCPNTSYQFSAWLANVLNPSRMIGVLPDVTFRIEKTDGTLIASYKTGGIPQTSSMSWEQYGFFFTTPADVSTVVLKMINTNVGGTELPGNDFALDDITFRACGADATASFKSDDIQSSLTTSPSASFTLYGATYPSSANYDYLWQLSKDGGKTWADIANSNKISITQIAPSSASIVVLYRMLTSQKGNIGSTNCRVTSNSITLNVNANPSDNAQCNNWLKLSSSGSGVKVGDIDISGQKLTVEATYNSTEAHPGGRLYTGDIVSKHSDPANTNYLLRPSSAEITTSNGYFITPVICDAELNKTYHVAMVYDGKTLKFYRNGFLMSQVSCTGDLYQNDFITTIGANALNPSLAPDESFRGYINEVRIWNDVRSQDQIKQYMNQPLPNPQSQTSLVAYYTFDNLNNKQGNPQWNGFILNNAAINQANPTCGSFVADSCGAAPAISIIPSFTSPDTVCVNTPFTVTNTTSGATTNHWNFCSPNLFDKSAITNLGNLNFNFPVYTDYVFVNGNYYMFLVNNNNGGNVLRLDYGSSMLNTPTTVKLNVSISDLGGNTEGIQIVQNNGRWYGIVVGGDPSSSIPSRVLKLDFGTSITNASPTVTNWGNPGNLLNYPHELYVYNENNHWYGFTANTYGNNVIKFDFGTDFSTTPSTSVFLNSFMNFPVGLHAVSQNTKRYLFVINAGTSNATSTLLRLDFNSSYNSTPTINNLGNLGGNLGAYDFTTVATCDQLIGMSVRANDDIVARFTFPNADITQTPVFLDTIASGQLNFPHSFSKVYHERSDSYLFIPNAFNNTFSRLKIAGCTSASPAGSNSTNPGTVSYNAPGTYTINLTVDEGLQTQATICKKILVIQPPKQAPPKDTSFCEGTSIRLAVSSPNGKYVWNTGSTDSSINVSLPGRYWVQINNGAGCGITDSFNVTTRANPVVNLGKDTGICKNGTFVLNAGNSGSTYAWQDGSTKSTYTATKGGTYYVTVTNASKCSKADTIKIADYPSPVLTGLTDSKICSGSSVQLSVIANETGNLYSWTPSSTLNNSTVANPTAKPLDTTNYVVAVTNINGCITRDTATVFVLPKPVVTSISDTGFCIGGSITLQTTISNASTSSWSPATGLSSASTVSPKATPTTTTSYIVTAKNDGCSVSDTVKLTVFALPSINAGNDTLVCGNTSVQLSATGGTQYHWSPATGLSNANVVNPVALINSSVTYTVNGIDKNGCSNTDSVQILNRSQALFAASASTTVICAGDSVLLSASGGSTYSWQPSGTILHPADSSTYAVPKASTTYSVTINDQQCKVSETKDIAITVNLLPQIRVAKSNDIDCREKQATLTANGASSYTWTPAVTDSIGTSIVNVSPSETTTYTVIATSDKGCVSTDTVSVKVNINLENQYPIQNAFSPNGDGINDCFGISSWNVLKVDFQIYDRWGVLLFHSTSPQDVCWDGRYKGKNQLDGAYVYKIYAVTACGIINKAGSFVLIRAAR